MTQATPPLSGPPSQGAPDAPPLDPLGPEPLTEPVSHPPPVAPPEARARTADATLTGMLLMSAVSLIFALQDAVSRHLGDAYPPILVVMLRYWFFALFVIAISARRPGGLRQAIRTRRPVTQILRGVVLVAEVTIMVEAFVRLGLIETHAVFSVYPLLVVALSGPVLGERIGWRRQAAVAAGFVGVLIVLQPGARAISPEAILPLVAALMFAVYGLMTRHVARDDSAAVSFFWTGISGAGAATLVGLWYWTPIAPADWPWVGLICMTAALSHFLLIRAYAMAEASALQPFAYLQLVFVSIIGVVWLGETLRANVALGAGIVVAAGLFTVWRERRRR